MQNKAVNISEPKFQFTTDTGVSVVNVYVCWSFYSKIQKLILDKFEQVVGDKVKIYNINADKNQSIVEQYNITSHPTILIFKDGQEVSHLPGLQDKDTLLDAVKKILN